MKIEVDTNAVTIEGTRVTHGTMLLACVQDDQELAAAYRKLAAQAAPMLKALRDEAYAGHLATPPAVSGMSTMGGHGTVVRGPEPVTQAAWMRLTRLCDCYAAAIRGEWRPMAAHRTGDLAYDFERI